jgi:hypothetical protein
MSSGHCRGGEEWGTLRGGEGGGEAEVSGAVQGVEGVGVWRCATCMV